MNYIVPSDKTLTIPQVHPVDDILSAALKYAKAGWYVGPLDLTAIEPKNPGSLLGKRWQDQTSRDPDQIKRWFAFGSNGIVGLFLHAGRSGTVVLDLDQPENFPAELLDHLDGVPTQVTNPLLGKRHHLFLQPPGRRIGNSTGKLGAGWGDVRGVNGVIVVTPTPHPDGGKYEWEHGGVVAVLPAEIADLLPDAGDTADAASDAVIRKFIDEHKGNAQPEMLVAKRRQFDDKVRAGESRHNSMVPVLAGAMEEARSGLYPAKTALDRLLAAFIDAVTSDGSRTSRQAKAEFHGIAAWGIGQANLADLDQVAAECAARLHRNRLQGWVGLLGANVEEVEAKLLSATVSDTAVVSDTARLTHSVSEMGGVSETLDTPSSKECLSDGVSDSLDTSDIRTHIVDGVRIELPKMTTGAELRVMTFEPIEYIVGGVITAGLGILAGAPKAGKSWLAYAIALAVAGGGKVLGSIEVKGRPVLYLALEDSDRRLQRRAAAILGDADLIPDNLTAVYEATYQQALAVIDWFLTEHGNEQPLVVVDTFGKVKPPKKPNQDSYQADYEAAGEFKTLVDRVDGAGILLVHHTRKAESGDFVDAVSGTFGIAGAADYVAVLKRKRKSPEAMLSITGVVGRDSVRMLVRRLGVVGQSRADVRAPMLGLPVGWRPRRSLPAGMSENSLSPLSGLNCSDGPAGDGENPI